MSCFPCICNKGYFGNALTHYQCVDCIKCQKQNREEIVPCTPDRDAQCGDCLDGYASLNTNTWPLTFLVWCWWYWFCLFSSPGLRPFIRRKLSHLNLLLWNRWTKLNLTWQGWSLGRSLSKLCPTAPPSIQDGCCY